MSGATVRLPLEEAQDIARLLGSALLPYCYRVEICGSLRRQRPTIGDIDLLCEPIVKPVEDMFGQESGETRDLLDERLTWMVERGHLTKRLDANGRPAWGKSLKRATFRGMAVDIRSCSDRDSWGAWLVISTGPADFNKRLVTERRKGGLLPAGFEFKDGFQLWQWGERIPTPTEAAVFAALGIEHRRPMDRG